jgi:membrane-associated phospholipid phosphatase
MTDSPAPRAAESADTADTANTADTAADPATAPGEPVSQPPATSPPPAGRRPLMLGTGLTLLAIAAAFAAIIAHNPAHPPVLGLDHAWLAHIQQSRTAALTEVAKVLSVIGGPIGGTIIVAILVVWFLVQRRFWTAAFLAATEASGSGASQLIKHLVLRHRPPHPLVTADIGSFPSGHVITTLAVGLALTAVLTRPGHRARALAAVAAATIVMMWCRTYLAAHWLTDTFESLAVAGGITLVLWWAFTPALAREAARRPGAPASEPHAS